MRRAVFRDPALGISLAIRDSVDAYAADIFEADSVSPGDFAGSEFGLFEQRQLAATHEWTARLTASAEAITTGSRLFLR